MEHANALQSLLSLAAAPVIAAMTGGAVLFFLGFVYQAGLDKFVEDVGQQQKSALVAVETVVVQRLASMVRGFLGPGRSARLKRRMIMAGLDMRDTILKRPEDFVAVQILAALAGALLALYLWATVHANLVFIPVGLAAGLFVSDRWLRDQVIKRHLLITRALPYNLDLLTLSVEAGLDFTAALAKVVERGRKGPLLDELALVLRQLKMGKTRAESLKMMVDRVNLTALSTFVSALIQADKMGTPLGKVLRIQSAQLRVERSQRAEKLAGEAPVKMLGPLIMCIMPTVFIVLFGPVIFAMKFNGG
ncbi:MAG: type II secretion system F family protein [Myxococcales bacterium]